MTLSIEKVVVDMIDGFQEGLVVFAICMGSLFALLKGQITDGTNSVRPFHSMQ